MSHEMTPRDHVELAAHEVGAALDRFLALAERYPMLGRLEAEGLALTRDRLNRFVQRSMLKLVS